jgi:hypothetical protein
MAAINFFFIYLSLFSCVGLFTKGDRDFEVVGAILGSGVVGSNVDRTRSLATVDLADLWLNFKRHRESATRFKRNSEVAPITWGI